MKQALIPLIFFAQFKRPLTLKQIRRYTWGREFEMNELKQILKKSHIKQVGEYYCLDESHLMESAERYKISEKFWKRVKKYRWIFSNVPFLRMVTVSNTLAYDYVKKDSDIDLFVVAAKNRVWIVRAFILIWLTILGVRTKHKNKRMKFSLEMLVDETALNLSFSSLANDYLVHYQIVDMVPIWGSDYFNVFWTKNRWLKDKLSVAYRSPNIRDDYSSNIKSSWFSWMGENILRGSFGDRVEAWVRHWQKKKIEQAVQRLGIEPNVITENHVIETHYHGRRSEIRDVVDEILAQYD